MAPPVRHVLIAPDAFKGALDAPSVALAIAAGVHAALPECRCEMLPVADGGEGTLDVLLRAFMGELREARVRASSGKMITARWGVLPDGRAIVESAEACGWEAGRDTSPWHGTTFGVGELIAEALDATPRPSEVLVALGGSRTVDGGLGMLEALGARLLDAAREPVPPGASGLTRLAEVDLTPALARLGHTRLVGLCDVQSPLLGPDGASMYMAQKGIAPDEVERLERALASAAQLIWEHRGGGTDGPGQGAAGGLGAAISWLGGELRSGADAVLDALDLQARLAAVDLVIGGEGQVDGQTSAGKAMACLATRAQRAGVPLVLLSGNRSRDLAPLHKQGVSAVFSIALGPTDLETALGETAANLTTTAEEATRLFAAGAANRAAERTG